MQPQTGYYGNVPQRLPFSTVGQRNNASYLDKINGLVNMDPEAKQVYTVTVDTGTNGATYTVIVNGVTVTYLSATTNTTTIATGIAAALNASSLTAGLFSSVGASAVVTLTAVNYGTDVVVTSGALTTTVETVAPADADPVYFGRGVLNLQSFSSNGMPLGSNAYAAKLRAQVRTLTIVYAAGEVYLWSIAVAGVSYSGQIAADTDSTTTAAALVAAVNAQMPASTVLASNALGVVTLTAEVPGLAFSISAGTKSGTAARAVQADVTVGPLSDINRCFAGVAISNYNQPGQTVGLPANYYVANSAMGVLANGQAVVYSEQTVTSSDRVYIETAAGANQGLFYNTSTSTRLQLTGATWIPRPSFDSSNLNIVSLAY